MIEFINMVFAGDRLADFADELGRALVEADHRRFGVLREERGRPLI